MTSAFAPRYARVLVALHHEPQGLRLSDLAALNGIPLSSAQRLLGALIRDGLVVRDQSRRPVYRLAGTAPGAAIEEVARWRLSASELVEVDRFLDTLRMRGSEGTKPEAPIELPESVREIRRTLLAILERRARPGAGSDLAYLRKEGFMMLTWWANADRALKGVPHAVFGAIAAMRYMPARHTADLDLAVRLVDLTRAEEALRKANWTSRGSLSLYGGLVGKAWVDADGHELDVIGLPGSWGAAAIASATYSKSAGMRSLILPYAVLTKMISSRARDVADISRMLGMLPQDKLDSVLVVVRKYMSAQDAEDVEQIAALGRLEAGRARRK